MTSVTARHRAVCRAPLRLCVRAGGVVPGVSGEILYAWGCFPARRDGAGGAGVRCSQPWPRPPSQRRAHRADPLQFSSRTTIAAHHADGHSQDLSTRVCLSRAGGSADGSGAVTAGSVAAGAAGKLWRGGCGIRYWHATRVFLRHELSAGGALLGLPPSSVIASASFVPSALTTLMFAIGLLGCLCLFRSSLGVNAHFTADVHKPLAESCLGRPRVIPIVGSTYTRGTFLVYLSSTHPLLACTCQKKKTYTVRRPRRRSRRRIPAD